MATMHAVAITKESRTYMLSHRINVLFPVCSPSAGWRYPYKRQTANAAVESERDDQRHPEGKTGLLLQISQLQEDFEEQKRYYAG